MLSHRIIQGTMSFVGTRIMIRNGASSGWAKRVQKMRRSVSDAN